MSKSKGDFLTVSLLESKNYNPLAYRMFCLQSHYRKPLTFSYESLDNVEKAYSKLVKRVSALKTDEAVNEDNLAPYRKSFADAMDNDLNTSLGLTCVYDVLKATDINDAEKFKLIDEFDYVLSLNLTTAKTDDTDENSGVSDDLAQKVEALIAKRAEAKKNKDWATADAIRDELKAMNITITDTPQGVEWKLEN